MEGTVERRLAENYEGGKYDIPVRAKGWRETDPHSGLSTSHAPIETYRSVVDQSFHSLSYQLALPSSFSRRDGLKGLHVRNKKGGGVFKSGINRKPLAKTLKSLFLTQHGTSTQRSQIKL